MVVRTVWVHIARSIARESWSRGVEDARARGPARPDGGATTALNSALHCTTPYPPFTRQGATPLKCATT